MNPSSVPQNSSGPLLTLLEKVTDLNERLVRVETHLHLAIPKEPAESESPSLFAPTSSAPDTATFTGPVPSVPASPSLLPAFEFEVEAARTSPRPRFSLGEWENLIGGKWALWVGSLCLFLAMASFLALSWRNLPPAPPIAKVAMGLGCGMALLVAGGWLRARTQRYFSEGLSGAGLSICYLSLWAGGQYFSVLSNAQSFLGMAMLTAVGVVLALRYDALSLSVLSTLGGFLTPVLLQSSGAGSGQALPFLSYVAFLDAGILAVSLRKRWRGLVWLSFAGTVSLIGAWAWGANFEALRWPALLFFSLYFALFLGASCFYSLFHQEETAPQDLLLLFAASGLYAVAGQALLLPVLGAYPGAFSLALSGFFGLLNVLVTRLAPANLALRYSLGGLSLLGATVAVPLQWHRSALTIGWIAEAAILLFLSGRLNSPLLRYAGQIVWLLTAIPLLADVSSPTTASFGFFSPSAVPLAVCVLISALIAWNARKRAANTSERDELEASYAAFSALGGAWLLGREIHRFFEHHHTPQSSAWALSANFAIAGAVGLYSLALFPLGIKWRHETLRFCALALCLGAAMGATLTAFSSPAMGTPLWNPRAAAFVVVGGVLVLLSRVLQRQNNALSTFEKQNADAWTTGTACFLLAFASLELYHGISLARSFWGFDGLTATFFALSMLWSLAATSLFRLGYRWRQDSLRVLALAVGSCALAALLWTSLAANSVAMPWLNLRGAAFAVAIISLGLSAHWLRRNASWLRRNASETGAAERQLATVLGFLALGLLLWSLTQESYALSRYSQAILGTNWQRWGQMLVSLVWSLFGALLLLGGIYRRHQNARLAALGLLCATVSKVFLFDLGFLNGPSRVLSLGGLGVALIFISWLYSRFGTGKIESATPSGTP